MKETTHKGLELLVKRIVSARQYEKVIKIFFITHYFLENIIHIGLFSPSSYVISCKMLKIVFMKLQYKNRNCQAVYEERTVFSQDESFFPEMSSKKRLSRELSISGNVNRVCTKYLAFILFSCELQSLVLADFIVSFQLRY